MVGGGGLSCFFLFTKKDHHALFIFQPSSPRSRAYEAPTPGSGWTNTPSGNYSDAGTPRDNGSAYGKPKVSFIGVKAAFFFFRSLYGVYNAIFLCSMQLMLQVLTCHQLLVDNHQ